MAKIDIKSDRLTHSKVLKGYFTKGGIESGRISFVIEGEKEKEVQAEVKKWLQEIKILK